MSTLFKSLPGLWQDKVVFLVGAFLFVSPWLFFYTDSSVAAWNAWTIGLVCVVGALVSVVYAPYWPEFVVAFLGFWNVLAPRILGYTDHTLATATAVMTGAVVAYLALWSSIVRAHAQNERAVPIDRPRPKEPPSQHAA